MKGNKVTNRVIRGVLASLCASAIGVAALVSPAVAGARQVDPSNGGYIEICKTFAAGPAGTPSYAGTFSYVVDGNKANPYTLTASQGGAQVCTDPIWVSGTSATVQEVGQPWFSVAAVAASPGDPGTVTAGMTNGALDGSATLSVNDVTSGNTTDETIVDYTNDPVTGTVEVCKAANSDSAALTGTYTFTIASANTGMTYSTTGSANISAPGEGTGCSAPITVPAGTIETTEQGTIYVTGIAADINGSPDVSGTSTPVLISSDTTPTDAAYGTAYSYVFASNSVDPTADETVVTYTDALSTVKLCKAWSGTDVPTTSFPFTASSSGAAGPTAVSASASIAVNNCAVLGYVRAGTQVNVTEGLTPGTKVEGISVSSVLAAPIVPGSESLPNGKVSVIAGAGVTIITYTDESADPGQLKICVNPTSAITSPTATFTVTPTAGLSNAPAGSHFLSITLSGTSVECVLDPYTYAYGSSVAISGSGLVSPDVFSGTPAASPSTVDVWETTGLAVTNLASLSGSTASSTNLLVSEGLLNIVTFSADPPAPVTGPTQTATPSAAAVAAAAGDSSGSSVTSTNVASSRVVKLEKQLRTTKAQIKALRKALASKHLSKAHRRADAKRLAALLRLEHKLLRELK